jgi:prevent-host-death family protein
LARLEQEQIGFHWLAHPLARRVDGTTAPHSNSLRYDHKKTIFSLHQIGSTAVRYSSQVKPISYLKANAAEVLTQLAERREPLVITQNGEAKAVLQDLASFEETQETLALLKILALGNQDVAAGKVKPVADVVARLRAKRAAV